MIGSLYMGLGARCNNTATLADQLACCWTTDRCNNTSKDAQAFDPAFGYIRIKHDNLPIRQRILSQGCQNAILIKGKGQNLTFNLFGGTRTDAFEPRAYVIRLILRQHAIGCGCAQCFKYAITRIDPDDQCADLFLGRNISLVPRLRGASRNNQNHNAQHNLAEWFHVVCPFCFITRSPISDYRKRSAHARKDRLSDGPYRYIHACFAYRRFKRTSTHTVRIDVRCGTNSPICPRIGPYFAEKTSL